MPNIGQDLLAGGAGFATGGIPGAVLGFGSSLLGLGQPHEDPQMKAMRQNQLGIQNNLLQYARSVPGSSPDELAGLSQARGQLGAQQRMGNQAAMAAWNPNQGTPAGQFVQNQQNAGIAQQMALSSGMLQNAAASRRQALLSAANVGTSAAEMYKSQPSGFPAVAAQLSQQMAYQNARNKGGAGPAAATATGGVPGDVPTNGPGPVNGPALPTGPVAGVPQSDWGGGGAGGDGAAASIQSLTGGDASAGMGGMPPGMAEMLQMFAQQMGMQPGMTAGVNPGKTMFNPATSAFLPAPTDAGPGLQGSMSPGNEPFGAQSTNNQVRQSNKVAGPPPAPTGMLNPGQVHEMLRMLIGPGGVRQSY